MEPQTIHKPTKLVLVHKSITNLSLTEYQCVKRKQKISTERAKLSLSWLTNLLSCLRVQWMITKNQQLAFVINSQELEYGCRILGQHSVGILVLNIVMVSVVGNPHAVIKEFATLCWLWAI